VRTLLPLVQVQAVERGKAGEREGTERAHHPFTSLRFVSRLLRGARFPHSPALPFLLEVSVFVFACLRRFRPIYPLKVALGNQVIRAQSDLAHHQKKNDEDLRSVEVPGGFVGASHLARLDKSFSVVLNDAPQVECQRQSQYNECPGVGCGQKGQAAEREKNRYPEDDSCFVAREHVADACCTFLR